MQRTFSKLRKSTPLNFQRLNHALSCKRKFSLDAVEALRTDGHDVAWIREDARGTSDDKILFRAQEENRIVLTFDKDFGELVFRSRFPAQSEVILFRITPISPQYIAQVVYKRLPVKAIGLDISRLLKITESA